MSLIKNENAIFDNILVFLIQTVIKEIIVGHEEQVTNRFDEEGIIIGTEVISLP